MSLDPQIKQAIEDAIDKKINGKLDILCDEVRGYRKEHKEHMEKLQPVLDGLQAVKLGRKGIIWITSLIVAIGGAIIILRRIF